MWRCKGIRIGGWEVVGERMQLKKDNTVCGLFCTSPEKGAHRGDRCRGGGWPQEDQLPPSTVSKDKDSGLPHRS